MFDICIVGGGAAGMTAAITAKSENPALSVLILERSDRVGKKISLTGNGRCNITNKNIVTERYHGRDPSFCEYAFSVFDNKSTEKFFESIGLPVIYEGEKAYPHSLQAASVTDALRFRCSELDVTTICSNKATALGRQNSGYSIKAEKGEYSAKAVIFAAGLMSGGAALGCDGTVFNMLKKFGFSYAEPSPAIVQLKTDTALVKQLKGIKYNGKISLLRNGKTVRTEEGEILFCDYGVSGPPVLQISGHAKKDDTLMLDLLPDEDFNTVCEYLKKRRRLLANRKNDEFLSGYINKRLGQVVIKNCGISLSDGVSDITDRQIYLLAEQLKKFCLTVTGNNGFINSQVSKGGILTAEFDSKTLMSRKYSGLFACGELLDIDGDCGGFNLQWAWSSGYLAGKSAAEYIGKIK